QRRGHSRRRPQKGCPQNFGGLGWAGARPPPASCIGCQRAAEAVAKAIIGADRRQRPVRVATIEREIGKLFELETARGVRTAHDAARRLVPKVGHHGHAAAITAKRIVHSTQGPGVRQGIPGEGDIASPGVRNAYPAELGKAIDHEAIEDRRTHLWSYRGKARPPTKYHALTVRRHAIVAEHALGIGEGTAFRNERACQIDRQFFGGDDVAGERDEPPFEVRGRIAGVAVRGNDDVAGLDLSSRRLDVPSAAEFGYFPDRCSCANGDWAPTCRIKETLVVERGMQLGGALHNHAAIVIVGGNFLTLPLPGHHVCLGGSSRVEARDTLLLKLIVPRRPRSHEATPLFQITVDALARDQRLDQAEGIASRCQHGLDDRRIASEHLAGEALADVDAAAAPASAACAGSRPELSGLKNARFDAGVSKLNRACKACITTAHDCYTRPPWHIDPVTRPRFVGDPPVGFRLEVLVEDVVWTHGASLQSGLGPGFAAALYLDQAARRPSIQSRAR